MVLWAVSFVEEKKSTIFQWTKFTLNGQKAMRGAEITPNYPSKSLIVKGIAVRTLPE